MKRSYAWLAIVAALVLALLAGWFIGRSTAPESESGPTTASASQPRKILYYRNPMGLADTSQVPKKDSMGMDYIPVYAGDEAPAAPGTVVLSPEKIQKLGVRTEQARLRPLASAVRASATVQIDETRQYVIAPKFEGWVEHLYADQTGMSVRRGQPLLSVYSPALVAAQQEYRVADAAARQLDGGDPTSAETMRRLRDAARSRLRNWDIGGAQLARLAQGDPNDNLVITSPADAVVVDKLIVQGARFAPGETILRLADLSKVWVIAEVPASRAGMIAIGEGATFTSTTLPGETFSGRVTFLQPTINPQTRTIGVRVELPNPDGRLRPGLFGDIVLAADAGPEVVTVPRSAVLDSGTRQLVLVQVGDGRFAPRTVVVGERAGDEVEIREGLAAGERVVVAANFLIDAESNLQSALEGMAAPTADDAADHTGHAGHDAHPSEPSGMSDHSGHDMQSTPAAPPTGHEGHEGHEIDVKPPPSADHGSHDQHGSQTDHAGHDPSSMEH